jgi:hypothetical protein
MDHVEIVRPPSTAEYMAMGETTMVLSGQRGSAAG